MKYLFCLLAMLAICGAELLQAGDIKKDIPNAIWEPIFFQPINNLTNKVGWTPLRKQQMPPNSVEVRIWIGFGLSPLFCYVIRRDGTKWTGQTAGEDVLHGPSVRAHKIVPKSDWRTVWDKLTKLGILTLPDSSTLKDEVGECDGVSFVVEINDNNHYRTYDYNNPEDQKWSEAKAMCHIYNVFTNEFTGSTIIPHISINNASYEDVIKLIRFHAHAEHLELVIDKNMKPKNTFSFEGTNINFCELLASFCEQYNLEYDISERSILISPKKTRGDVGLKKP